MLGIPNKIITNLDLKRLGTRIEVARTKANLNQHNVAELTGLNRSYLCRLERGHENISVVNLHKIAQALGTTMADLLRGLG